MVSLAKLLVIVSCVCLARKYLGSEFHILRRDIHDLIMRRHFKRLVLFAPLYLSVTTLTMLAPFLHGTALRLLVVDYLSLSATAAVIHRNITGQHAHQRAYFDEEFAEILLRESNMAYDAMMAYRREIITAAVPALLIMVVLMTPPSAGWSAPDICGYVLIALTAFIAVCYGRQWIFIHGKGWSISFPSIIMIPIQSFISIARKEVVPHKILSDVTITHAPPPMNKVVFIMDESIRGDYTTLGDPRIDTTPYLAHSSGALVNFGVATSGHNCSSYSRYIFRHGARIEELPQALVNGLDLPGPTVWQFAKSAGLRTVYIDGFSNDLRLHSGMSLREACFIDRYVRIPAVAPHQRDVEVAKCLLQALADPAPAFIYVDKYGVHMPYENKVPPGYAPFKAGSDACRAERLIAAYKNAVRWNVDHFFQQVLPGQDLSRMAMIYTSDHGQSLLEGGYAASHCSTGPDIAIGEALVPLLAIAGDESLRAALQAAAGRMLNRASHFDIFPTLLTVFGYDRHEVEAIYGAGLFGAPRHGRRFLSGFKASARWQEA